MERGLKKLHLVQAASENHLNVKQKGPWYAQEWGGYLASYRGLEGLQLSLRGGLYIIASIDCGVWYLDDNDDKVQYWP